MPILGINHVAIKVRSLERARKFYELLGFVEAGHRDGMLFFSAGNHHHHIAMMEVGEDAGGTPGRSHVGVLHFALTVDDEAEIGRLYRLLTGEGYEEIMKIDHHTNRGFYIRDGDGNAVEITYDAPKEDWADVAENPFATDKEYEIPTAEGE